MWPSVRLTFTAALIVLVSFFVVAFTSSYAFVRAQVEHVDVDLASVIRADYSADPRGAKLAPLDEEIVDVARQDVSRLQETATGVEIVAVYHQPASAATEPEVFATPSAKPGQAPPASTPNEEKPTPSPTHGVSPASPTPGSSTPHPETPEPATPPPEGPSATPHPTAAPTSPSTPGPSPITTLTPGPTQTRTPTPGPSPSPTSSPTGTPTATPAPTAAPTATPPPTLSPTPAPTESPTPTSTPVPVNGTFYLHNDPTPPMGDTSSQPVLPMDPVMPTTPVLYNYDVDRDGSPGLVIARGGSGPYEGDPTKYQAWRAPELSGAVVIDGDAKVHLWSAMKDFNSSNVGVVTVYVQDCYAWSCVELGSDTATKSGSGWMLLTFSVPVGTYTLAPGHNLGLVVVVDASSDDDMWFAYDTGPYRSRLAVTATSADVVTSEVGALWPLGHWPASLRARLLLA